MSQDETMRLVAELTDKVSGPWQQMMKLVKGSGDTLTQMHKTGATQAREHAKAYKELHESIRKIKETALNVIEPGMASLGVTAFSVAGAIAAISDAVKGLGEAGEKLTFTARQSGATIGMIRALGDAGQRFGVTQESMNAGLAKFGAFMDQNARRAPDALNAWNQMPGAWQRIGKSLVGLNRDAQINKVLDFIPTLRYEDQKRKLLNMLGLPENWASLTKEESLKFREAGQEFNRIHPFAIQNAERSKKAFDAMASSLRGIRDDLGAAFAPQVVAGFEALHKFLDDKSTIAFITGQFEAIGRSIRDTAKEIDAIIDAAKSFNDWRLGIKKPGDGKFAQGDDPMGKDYTRGSSGQAKIEGVISDVKSFFSKPVLKDAITEGFLDALRQQNSAGGMSPIAFHPSGNSPGGYFGTKEYPALGPGNPLLGGGGGGGGDPMARHHTGGGGGGGGGRAPGGGGPTGVSPSENDSASLTGGGGALGPFERSRFQSELAKNPALRDKIMRIASNEQGSHPGGTQAVMESMMNRAAMRGTSLQKEARWTSEGGYYQNGYMGRGALENARSRAILEQSYKNTLGGADTIGLATDNSSQGLAERERVSGKFAFHKKIHGESFFHPGWAEPKFRDRWVQMKGEHDRQLASAASTHGARLADHIRHGRKNATDGTLLQNGKRSDAGNLNGSASLQIDLNGFPRGTRTASQHEGLFKQVTLNRGRPMAPANENS